MATATDPSTAQRATAADAARLVLRLALGVLILLHGIAKLRNGVDPVAGMLTGHGLPGALAYGVYVGEVLAPLLVIVGAWSRIGALLIVGNMLVALGLAHMNDLARLNQTGGWAVELQMMYLFGALAIALLGAGRFSVGGTNGRCN